MRHKRRHRDGSPWARMVTGLLVLGVGVVFLLDQMGVEEAEDLFEWWPVAFLALGLAALLNRSYLGALIWFAAGTILLLPRLGFPEVEIGEALAIWPLLISVGGIALVRQALRPLPKTVFGEDAAIFRAGAFMSGNAHSIGSRDFAGGEAVAFMGGCEIDLRGAELRRDEAIIDVLAFWGGIGIKVPESWTVENHVMPVLGGLDDKTSGGDGKKRLILRGSAIMGGVEVSN
ncbi:MAG TPA: DUF5668 domain-containing protein [Thermoanaerobaculia bacterium]|nr:DUF5668 domain-containing protein [Thermoanaerobaculia bacterium]